MIKLIRADRPDELTDEFIRTHTDEFKAAPANSKPSPWNQDWLKRGLLNSSHDKCAYCECNITEESKYMEVEHFRDKKDFPDHILIWENLLPSCKRCNGRKSSHNVETEGMIINPYEENPIDHLYLESCRIKGKDKIGKMTVEVLYLNDSERLVKPRSDNQEAIEKEIDKLEDKLREYLEKKTTVRRNKLLDAIEGLLIMCQPEKGYAATCATVLHRSIDFNSIVDTVKAEGLWTEDLNLLFDNSLQICLFKP